MVQGKMSTPDWLFGTVPHYMIFSDWSGVQEYLMQINNKIWEHKEKDGVSLTTNENNEEEITMHDQGLSPEFAEVYVQTVQDGTDFAAKQRVAILSIARNSEDKLIQNLPFLDTLSEWFKECSFFFYENDSSDNTPHILQNWANSNPKATTKCEKLDTEYLPLSTSTTRTENLAKARNHCIEYVKQNIDNLDYVIVLDSDFIDFSVRGLLNSFGWISKHPHISAMVGFNFLKKYIIFPNGTQTKNKILTNYDSWAYRHTLGGQIFNRQDSCIGFSIGFRL